MRLPDDALKMLQWPNTPSRERLERAIEFYARTREFEGNYVQVAIKGREAGEQVEQAIRDLPAITVIMENPTWQTWCQKTMEREMPPDMNPMEISLTLVRIAGCGDNQDSTGLAVMAWKPREGEQQDPAIIHFGLMARDPGWAGACPQLQHADGLTAPPRQIPRGRDENRRRRLHPAALRAQDHG